MRVLLISPLPPPAGGIASWTKRYLESEIANENNVDVVNTALIGNRANNFKGKKNIFVEYKRLQMIIKSLKLKLKKNEYDIVHLNSSCGSTGLIKDLILSHIVKKKKIKLLVHFRCDVKYSVHKNRFSTILLKKIVNLSDNVITLNSVSREFIKKVCNKESYTIPNYISEDYLSEINTPKNISEKADTVLFVGHVTNAKGCDLIYEIASNFPEKRFILVGKVMNPDFENASMPKNIILKGEIPLTEVKKEYLDADIFLFPTHTEGFPNAVSEAMACGLPIIATPVGAIPDMLENEGGFLIAVNDKNACIDAIKKINSPEIRKKMSDFNRNKVKTEYSIEKVMHMLFDIYQNG